MTSALGSLDRSSVVGGVLGVAGAGAAGAEEVRRQAVAAWQRLELPGEPVVVTDLLTAFAAGSAAPTGSVLVAGTGAGAAAVVEHRVARQADGAGWLLGDTGSAVWLVREGLVAAVADLDGRGPASSLTGPLTSALVGHPGPGVQDVIAAAYSWAPAALGRLAPVVTNHASGGDEVAAGIVERGVAGLLASLDAVLVRRAGAGGPGRRAPHDTGTVLAGVTAGLASRGVSAHGRADHPAAGAAWLALVQRGVADPAVHAALAQTLTQR